jgi:hypothetical protein
MKKKAFELIKEFFGVDNRELMAMPQEDRRQLASSIARAQGLAPEGCEFELCAY